MKGLNFEDIIYSSPFGFAHHKIILDNEGKPVDYEFLEVNNAFEQLTGLSKKQIIGKTVTDVIPGIEKSSFDWIGFYGEVAINGERKRI